MVNTENFMTVLHEEEMLDDASLDSLKGGFCIINLCECNKTPSSNCGTYTPEECDENEPDPEDPDPESPDPEDPDPEEPDDPV